MTTPETHDLMLRDVLASELKCWHRLTSEESQNLIDFIKNTIKPQPQRKPLQASEIVTMYAECPTSDKDMVDFARAIENAHGIKE